MEQFGPRYSGDCWQQDEQGRWRTVAAIDAEESLRARIKWQQSRPGAVIKRLLKRILKLTSPRR